MATVSKQMFIGAATAVRSTLYTVPSSTTSVVTEIAVSNTESTASNFTIYLNGVLFSAFSPINAYSTVILDIKQALTTGQTIEAFASNSTINFFISGVEIS